MLLRRSLALLLPAALLAIPAPDPAPAQTAGGVYDLLFARPFTVEQPFHHVWRAEQPLVDAGYLLVLDVDPEVVVPRQMLEPVLYVGQETAERINFGHEAGRLVVMVPSARDANGLPALDLGTAPIWFGSPELPERVTAGFAQSELGFAVDAGIAPFPPARIDAAFAAGGPLVQLADQTALLRHAAQLIYEWAPAEAAHADSMLAPLVD